MKPPRKHLRQYSCGENVTVSITLGTPPCVYLFNLKVDILWALKGFEKQNLPVSFAAVWTVDSSVCESSTSVAVVAKFSASARPSSESNRSKRGVVPVLFSGLCSPFRTFSVCSEAGQGSQRSNAHCSFSNTSFELGHWMKNHVKKLWDSSSVDCYWMLLAAWNQFGTSLASAQEVEKQRIRTKPVAASLSGTSPVEVPPKYQNMDMSSHLPPRFCLQTL